MLSRRRGKRVIVGKVLPTYGTLALNKNQPLGNSRFYARIEATTGQRREARQRGRPRVQRDESKAHETGQGK